MKRVADHGAGRHRLAFAPPMRRPTATSSSPRRPAAPRASPTCAISPRSACSPPNASRGPSPAASMRRRPALACGAPTVLARALRPVISRTVRRDRARGSVNGASPVIISASSRPLTGPSVRPRCWWPKSNHRPLWRGAGADDRQHVGQAGPPAEPGRGVAPLGEREEFARERLQPVEMGGGRRIVAPGEFGAGGQAEAARHRRDDDSRIRRRAPGGSASRCPRRRNACDSRA